MSDTIAARVRGLERQRIQALLDQDISALDALHHDDYRLCNPTGAVWGKAEYLERLATGRLRYDLLATVSGFDVLSTDALVVLCYRCVIALEVEGIGIGAHQCHHVDVYVPVTDGQWRCRYSQATAVADTVPDDVGRHLGH